MAQPFEIGGTTVAPGTRASVELPVSVLSDHTPVTLSAEVIHGRRPGPTIFVSAAVHGDEVIGVEIVRRLLRAGPLARLSGTLIAVPVVNTFGFLHQSRYLPDRRDLNRCFPGLAEGSMASRARRTARSRRGWPISSCRRSCRAAIPGSICTRRRWGAPTCRKSG